MRLLVDIAIAIIIAVCLGAASAWYSLEQGRTFGALTIGEWTAWPSAGTADADPYSAALLARSGEVPIGSGEGLAFLAENDSEGRPLTGRCSYVVVGQTPTARLWTLTAYSSAGHLMANPSRRQGFHSRELLRRPDGRFEITVSNEVTPGNWLPIEPVQRLRLVLRLYDTQLGSGNDIGDFVMPRIVRSQCS